MLLLLLLSLPLVLAAVASYCRCLAQRNGQLMFVDGPLYGSMVAAAVFAAFAFYAWCFPGGGPGPSPVGMSEPSVTTWGILTGIYAIAGVFIGLAAATLALIVRHFGSRGGSAKSP